MTDPSPPRRFRPLALGEIAIRCADMARMIAFYRDVIGLELLTLRAGGAIAFFKIAEGFGGHTTVLALFDQSLTSAQGSKSGPKSRTAPTTGEGSSLHHIALSLPFAELGGVKEWYDSLGQPYTVEDFDWIGWRGIFTRDPEGNTVELVAYDASLLVADPS